MRVVLAIVTAALLLAVGCGGPGSGREGSGPGGAPTPAPPQGAEAPPPPAPSTMKPLEPYPAEPLTAEVRLYVAGRLVNPDGPIPVGTPSARVRFRFSAPMDREAVIEAIGAQLKGVPYQAEWMEDGQWLWLTVEMGGRTTVTLDSAGFKDRFGRLVQSGTQLTLKAPPRVTVRLFSYIPSTDEGHPFTWETVDGLFTEGAADPVAGSWLILWAKQEAGGEPIYTPLVVGGGRPQWLPYSHSGAYPWFYGWMPQQEWLVLGSERTVRLITATGTVLKTFPLPEATTIHGGAVSRRSGRVALFLSGQDGQVRLVVWNPESGEQTEYGAVEDRRTASATGGTGFGWQWIDADWSPDDGEIAFSSDLPAEPGDEKLYRFRLADRKVVTVADGYTRPRYSPADSGHILAQTADHSAILSPTGKVLHELTGRNWFWHRSGQALDRSESVGAGEAPPYGGWVTNYRLSDRRYLQRGKGLVVGHAILPPSGSRRITLTTD